MPQDKNCIFCKLANGEIPRKIIYENDNFIAFPDANPKIEGHCLIVSKKHFVNSIDMPASLGSELVDAVKNTFSFIAKKDKTVEGFNLVQNNFPAAGQAIMHTHWHLLPRRKGDGRKLRLDGSGL